MGSEPESLVAEPAGQRDAFHARQVEAMAGYGIPPEDIATVLGIDPARLRRDYQAELQGASIKANAKVAESLFRKATGDGRESVTAAIFWLKTRAGWKEVSRHEIGGPDGAPLIPVEYSNRQLAMAMMAMLRDSDTGGDAVEVDR